MGAAELSERIQRLTAELERVRGSRRRAGWPRTWRARCSSCTARASSGCSRRSTPTRAPRLADDGVVSSLLLIHGLHPVPRRGAGARGARRGAALHGVARRQRGAARRWRTAWCACGSWAAATAARPRRPRSSWPSRRRSRRPRPTCSAWSWRARRRRRSRARRFRSRRTGNGTPARASRSGRCSMVWTTSARTTRALVTVAGERLLVARVETGLLAYRDACKACGASLEDAELREGVLSCTSCGRAYYLAARGALARRRPDPARPGAAARRCALGRAGGVAVVIPNKRRGERRGDLDAAAPPGARDAGGARAARGQLRPLRHLDARGPPPPAPARRAQHRLRVRELLGAPLRRRRVRAHRLARGVARGPRPAGRPLGALPDPDRARLLPAHRRAAWWPSTRARPAPRSRSSTWGSGASSARRTRCSADLEPEAEALIVDRMVGAARAPRSRPTDEAYRLVGLVKASWQGISGGPERGGGPGGLLRRAEVARVSAARGSRARVLGARRRGDPARGGAHALVPDAGARELGSRRLHDRAQGADPARGVRAPARATRRASACATCSGSPSAGTTPRAGCSGPCRDVLVPSFTRLHQVRAPGALLDRPRAGHHPLLRRGARRPRAAGLPLQRLDHLRRGPATGCRWRACPGT